MQVQIPKTYVHNITYYVQNFLSYYRVSTTVLLMNCHAAAPFYIFIGTVTW